MTSAHTDLLRAAVAAVHALRSYQYGNSAPDLAEEIADALDKAVGAALDDRDAHLESLVKRIDELQTMLEQIKTRVDLLPRE